ncbi:hypothetical protein H5410_049970 [Solanum commersonii]|uniref:Uncharacterized protein n=1 Tax=Solanum commersonii TaxID=4109 RepID=A0A9J5WVJ8_SOLCO|nr:hypothetical protein H5410_049970 [Solanum commersonii]
MNQVQPNIDIKVTQVRPLSGSVGCFATIFFFDWNHFKKKLALRFWKQTDAKSFVADTQITRILALLQKLEDKCSFISPQVLVEDAGISAATVVSREISSSLAEKTQTVLIMLRVIQSCLALLLLNI